MAIDIKDLDLSEDERNELISRLVDELPVLRTKLGISQTDLANLIGVSRQTYSSIETKRREMSWGIYLSLVLVFDNNKQTHDYIRKLGLFPQNIIRTKDTSGLGQTISSFIPLDNDDIRNHLDERAIHAIETVIMLEYARCNNMTGEAVIKSFDGKRITQLSDQDSQVKAALDRIKEKKTMVDRL